jgi:hypothetical protein
LGLAMEISGPIEYRAKMFMKAVDNIVKDTVVNSEIPKLTFLPCHTALVYCRLG